MKMIGEISINLEAQNDFLKIISRNPYANFDINFFIWYNILISTAFVRNRAIFGLKHNPLYKNNPVYKKDLMSVVHSAVNVP